MRGEPTGPLPVPSVVPKRRYEATPSQVAPRPLAPHTDMAEAKPLMMLSPQPAVMHEKSRYPPLAQATGAPPIAASPLLSDERTAARPGGLPPQRLPQGPRMGFFTEERRDGRPPPPPSTTHPPPRPVEVPQRHTPVELARIEPLQTPSLQHRTLAQPGSPLPPPSALPSQQTYLQAQQQAVSQPPVMPAPHTHSRHPSLTTAPNSPVPVVQRTEPDMSPARRESFGQRPYFSLPGQHPGVPQQPPMLSPPKDAPRPNSTPAQPAEPPRQVPAKRSNIMNILNDEPEEPQPRKRFASEQTSAAPTPSVASPSRPVYPGGHSVPASASGYRHEEPTQQKPPYLPPGQPQQPSQPRSYSDYQGYSVPSTSTGPANHEWMARFDPRGQQHHQQQQQQQQQAEASAARAASVASGPPPPFASYAPSPAQSVTAASSVQQPPGGPGPPPTPSQRPAYHTVFTQPAHTRSPSLASTSRELPQSQPYRPPASPSPRHSVVGYGSRQGPPTPAQSPATVLNMAPRQPSGPPYAASAQHQMVHQSHPSQGGHPSYQQHVQAMVSGAHQQAAYAQRGSISLGPPGGAQYGHNTPPPAAQISRTGSVSGPSQPLGAGRSYTPPAPVHPPPTPSVSSLGYAGSAPQPPGAMHHPQARHPGPVVEPAPGPPSLPGHRRVYSQGSNPGPLPGPLAQPPPR